MLLIRLHGGLVKLEKRVRLISADFVIEYLSVRNIFLNELQPQRHIMFILPLVPRDVTLVLGMLIMGAVQ